MNSRTAPLNDWQYYTLKYVILSLYVFGVAGLIGLFAEWKKGLVLLSLAALSLLATPFRLLAVACALGMVASWSIFAFLTKGRPLALVPAGISLAILIPLLWHDVTHHKRDKPKKSLTWEPRKYSLRELIWDLAYGLLVYAVYRSLTYAWSSGLLP